jgi:hypothetical protein
MVVGARQEDAASSRADFGVDEPARVWGKEIRSGPGDATVVDAFALRR